MKKYKFLFVIAIAMFVMLPFKVSAVNIRVKKLDGKDLVVQIELTDTVETLKEKVYLLDNTFLPEIQKLIYKGKILENNQTLEYYELENESTINLILTLKKIKVIMDANGGTFRNDVKTINIEDIINFDYEAFEKPTRDGYKFVGFYTADSKSYYDVMNSEAGIEDDTTFYAKWEENSAINPPISDDVENPQTSDNIVMSIFMGIISLISLIGILIYTKRNKVRA